MLPAGDQEEVELFQFHLILWYNAPAMLPAGDLVTQSSAPEDGRN